MASKEEILGQFQLYNINPTSDVIEKCLSLCVSYNIESEELVDQWVAYTSSNLRGEAPTVEHLEKMERKEYQKNKDQVAAKLPSHKDRSPYVVSTHQSSTSKLDAPSTPKSNQTPSSRIQTPIQSKNLANEFKDTISSPGSQVANYSKRVNALAVQCSYGNKETTFKSKPLLPTIKMVFDGGLKANQTFLYEIIGKKGKSLNNMAEDLIVAIRDKYKLGVPNEAENDEEVSNIYAGRIVSDSDGKLNNQSVLLELTQIHMGRTIQLNLSKVDKYSLFPGQVVVVKGDYTKQYKRKKPLLVVQEIFADTDFTLPSEPPLIIEAYIKAPPITSELPSLNFI
ncbi:hypothetical protein GWI33_018796 [Rhynchophorus ferrugineus]|uniref:Uncharacterized protein n=1 Tax=Rhynchophorus ferrugineus TaxID=354439 RepID=A0A834HVP0_RHYFE|nr:hypothetical protein GWI33_018796 [Rhynchophorus ferrugineus]